MFRRASFVVAVVVLQLLGAGVARADDPYRIVLSRVDPSDYPTVRLVASVVDANGKAVPGLRPQDLQVREGTVAPQASVTLASMVSSVALALVIDSSGSMAGQPLADAKAAVSTMVGSLGAVDQVAILSFNSSVRVVQPLTSDKARALAGVGSIVAGGDTAIYDAAQSAADLLEAADPKARRAIILLTDGLDTASRSPRSSAVAHLAGSGFPLYAIGLGNGIDRGTLDALSAAAGGGATYLAPSSADLAGIYAKLSEQLLTEYSVEYRSAATGLAGGSTITFEVTVARAGAILASATGSFTVPLSVAPTQPSVPTSAPAPAAVIVPVIPARAQNTWIVGLLGAMTALVFVLWLNELTLQMGSHARRRLRALISGTDPGGQGREGHRLFDHLVGPLRSIGRGLTRFLPAKYVEQTRERLERAGDPLGVTEFLGLRITSTIVACAVITTIVVLINRTPFPIAVAVTIGAAAGFVGPGIALTMITRSRRSAMQRALIPSLDMLALSAEAGLAFDGAIAQVVLRWKNPLSDELRRLLLEFQMGRERKQALRGLARRTGLPDLLKFVNAVIQADTLGVGLAKVLADQALELRTKRRQRAEEQARIAPVKMMFPMVLLIFPALFVVILGPAVPKLTTIFTVGGGP
ncbi:MAG: VWA domain-containing protein [Chloroflexi bacterium]|nr:MAG: VWA domain-containing protein [Chloroflexota bacterium]